MEAGPFRPTQRVNDSRASAFGSLVGNSNRQSGSNEGPDPSLVVQFHGRQAGAASAPSHRKIRATLKRWPVVFCRQRPRRLLLRPGHDIAPGQWRPATRRYFLPRRANRCPAERLAFLRNAAPRSTPRPPRKPARRSQCVARIFTRSFHCGDRRGHRETNLMNVLQPQPFSAPLRSRRLNRR